MSTVAQAEPIVKRAASGGIVLGAADYNFSNHDGVVTIANPARGTHRTFSIETMGEDSNFAPGRRVVSLLIGPDRSDWTNWQGFAFADDEGIRVWRKHEGGVFETLARMIENPRRWEAKGCEYMAEVACRRCGRPLTNPESVASGLGPVCSGKI